MEDKINLSEEQKLKLSKKDNVQHKDRAEILYHNSCCGNANELTSQFSEVSKLSRRVQKPVFHFTLSLAHGENLSKNQLIEIAQECTAAYKVDQHQYVVVLHKDTHAQHIHIVANRVGYGGKVASDSNSYLRMANLCRELELKHDLKQVLSPRAFLPKEQRMIPRQNIRMDQLKKHIQQVLKQVNTFDQFEQKMKALGFEVLKGRGISFIDDKKVKIKGSEVGYSLMTIERILNQKQIQKPVLKEAVKEKVTAGTNQPGYTAQKPPEKKPVKEMELPSLNMPQNKVLETLMRPEHIDEPNPSPFEKKKKKKHKRRLNL